MTDTHTKKSWIIVSTLIALGIIVSAVAYVGRKAGTDVSAKSGIQSQKPVSLNTLDSDSDGLLDWEELLAGTDPDDPDTDGDGVSDKESLTASNKPAQSQNSSIAGSKELTETEKFSQSLFSQFLTAQRFGGNVENSDIQQLMRSTSLNLQNDGKKFATGDFLQVKSDASSIGGYLNSVSAIFLSGEESYSESEIDVFIEFSNSNNPSVLKQLWPFAEEYFAISKELEKTAVPASLLSLHTNLTQAVYDSGSSLQRMASMEKPDPLLFVIVSDSYHKSTLQINQNLKNLVDIAMQGSLNLAANDPIIKLKFRLEK